MAVERASRMIVVDCDAKRLTMSIGSEELYCDSVELDDLVIKPDLNGAGYVECHVQ